MCGGGGQQGKRRGTSVILLTMKKIFKKAQSKKKFKHFISVFIFKVIRGSKWKLKLYPNINKNNLSETETETELKWAFLVTKLALKGKEKNVSRPIL